MEKIIPSTSKSAMNYGAMLGLILMVLTLIVYVAELYSAQWINWVSTAILIGGVILGIKRRRDNELGGFISYSSSLGYGTLVSFFAAIITAVVTFLYISYVDDGFIQFTLEKTENDMYANGMPDEQIEMAMSMTKKWVSPGIIGFTSVFITTLVGFIVSLIASAFLKKEASPFEEI